MKTLTRIFAIIGLLVLNTKAGKAQVFSYYEPHLAISYSGEYPSSCIYVDRRGHKWQSSASSNQLNYFNKKTWVRIAANGSQVFCVNSIDSAEIWVGTNDGIVVFDSLLHKSILKTGSETPASNIINTISFEDKRKVWVGTEAGFYLLQNAIWTLADTNSLVSKTNIKKCFIDTKNRKWVGTNIGLFVYNDTDWTIYNTDNSAILNDTITAISEDINGLIWIGGPKGISVWDGIAFTFYTTTNSNLLNNNIKGIHIDPLNNKWLATDSIVQKISNLSVWENYPIQSTIIVNDEKGNLLANGLFLKEELMDFDNNQNKFILSKRIGLNVQCAQHVRVDSSQILWVSTYANGLYKFDEKEWVQYSVEDGLPSNSIRQTVSDNNGYVWIATDSGLVQYNGTKFIVYNQHNSPLTSIDIIAIGVDKTNNKWISTKGQGLFKLTPDSLWVNYTTTNTPNLCSNTITSVIVDSSNQVWFGSINGTSMLNGNSWTHHLVGKDCRFMIVNARGNRVVAGGQNIADFREGSFYEYKKSAWVVHSLVGMNTFYSIAFGADDDIYTSFSVGLSPNPVVKRLSGRSWLPGFIPTYNFVWSSSDGSIWLSGYDYYRQGLVRYNEKAVCPFKEDSLQYNISKSAQSIQAQIENQSDWEVVIDQQAFKWVHPAVFSGTGNKVVAFSLDRNFSIKKRIAEFKIVSKCDTSQKIIIKITQEGDTAATPYFTVDFPSNSMVKEKDTVLTIIIKSNTGISWDISNSAPGFLYLSKNKGIDTDTIQVLIGPNPTLSARQGYLSIYCRDSTISFGHYDILISQDPGKNVVENIELVSGEQGGNISHKVLVNNWRIVNMQISDAWFHINQIQGDVNDEITINVEANGNLLPRFGKFYIMNSDTIAYEVSIKQYGLEKYLNISLPQNISLSYGDTLLKMIIYSNIEQNWTLSINDANWITPSKTTGIKTDTVLLFVSSNKEHTARSNYLSVQSDGLHDDATITQSFLGATSIAKKRSQINSSIEAYPNPFVNQIELDLNNAGLIEDFSFELVNIVGQEILKGRLESTAIELNSIEKGSYYLKIFKNMQYLKTIKVVKL